MIENKDGCLQIDIFDLPNLIPEPWVRPCIKVINQRLKDYWEQQTVVYGRISPEHEWFDEAGPSATHTARLCGVREIRKETAEDVLRDFANEMAANSRMSSVDWNKLMLIGGRARKVLGEES